MSRLLEQVDAEQWLRDVALAWAQEVGLLRWYAVGAEGPFVVVGQKGAREPLARLMIDFDLIDRRDEAAVRAALSPLRAVASRPGGKQ